MRRLCALYVSEDQNFGECPIQLGATSTLYVRNDKTATVGAITSAEGATIDVGQKRELTLAGEGTVNVALTAAEYKSSSEIVVFTTDSADVKFGKVTYNGSECAVKTQGGTITKILKGIMFYVK